MSQCAATVGFGTPSLSNASRAQHIVVSVIATSHVPYMPMPIPYHCAHSTLRCLATFHPAGDMPYGCDHHGTGKAPCSCDFCAMGKSVPGSIFRKNEQACRGLKLSQGPDPGGTDVKLKRFGLRSGAGTDMELLCACVMGVTGVLCQRSAWHSRGPTVNQSS
jgi:hypothetical protein